MTNYRKESEKLESKRNEFYEKLKQDIYDFSSTHLWGGSCDDTVRYALKKNGFATLGVESGNIYKNINSLIEISEECKDIKIIKGGPSSNLHMTAQMIANSSQGDFIVIGLLANFKYPDIKKGGCHHTGIVIKSKISKNPLIGQGGVTKTDYIFMPASWSFSFNWKNANGVKNKSCVIYVKYGLKA